MAQLHWLALAIAEPSPAGHPQEAHALDPPWLNVPALQALHVCPSVAPAGASLPAGQLLPEHAAMPVLSANLPALHASQMTEPDSFANCPIAHGVHDASALPGVAVPAAKLPAVHAVQLGLAGEDGGQTMPVCDEFEP